MILEGLAVLQAAPGLLRGGGTRKVTGEICDAVNGPNLRECIRPTRDRAHLVLHKGPDHAVESLRMRKL